jgi:hypothetical protein
LWLALDTLPLVPIQFMSALNSRHFVRCNTLSADLIRRVLVRPTGTKAYSAEFFRTMGSIGGSIGGRKSAETLSAAQRPEKDKRAIAARWAKKKGKK